VIYQMTVEKNEKGSYQAPPWLIKGMRHHTDSELVKKARHEKNNNIKGVIFG